MKRSHASFAEIFLKCGDRKVLYCFYEVQSIRKIYGILRRLDGFREICPGGYLIVLLLLKNALDNP